MTAPTLVNRLRFFWSIRSEIFHNLTGLLAWVFPRRNGK